MNLSTGSSLRRGVQFGDDMMICAAADMCNMKCINGCFCHFF
eukprot:COSAG04_NODE_2351_length_4287_cov_3.603868_1_plen_41_part_10